MKNYYSKIMKKNTTRLQKRGTKLSHKLNVSKRKNLIAACINLILSIMTDISFILTKAFGIETSHFGKLNTGIMKPHGLHIFNTQDVLRQAQHHSPKSKIMNLAYYFMDKY